jgi:hypothetical protein
VPHETTIEAGRLEDTMGQPTTQTEVFAMNASAPNTLPPPL